MPRTTVAASGITAALLVLVIAACASPIAGTPAVGPTTPTSSATTNASTSTTATPTTETSDVADTSDSTETSDAPGTTPPQVTVTTSFASGVTAEEFAVDLKGAVEVADDYWSRRWADFYPGTYEPPTVVGLYDGTDEANPILCDGEPLEAFNAFYCPDGHFVAWDVSLMERGVDLIGDTWVYLVVAHEWGHAVQSRIDPALVSESIELQADCLAAAALFGAVADETLRLDEGDEKEMVSSLSLLADEMAWTSTADHGDPFQRVEWFTLGRNGGVPACHEGLGYVQPTPPTTATTTG